MTRHTALLRAGRTAAPLLALALLAPSLASAQATRTWVSGVGDDANPCSRTAPCKTFAGAISKTAAGGEIDALDPGGYGAVTITKSITIDGGPNAGGVLAAGTNGVTISTPANAHVTLRRLSINGAGSGLNGVRIVGSSGFVRLSNVEITGFTQSGVDISNSAGTSSRVEIRRSEIYNNYGTAPNGVGIWSRPALAGLTSKLTISDTSIDNNGRGVVADAAIGRSKITVRNSTIEDNGVNGGTGQGAQADGANASIRFTGTAITGNVIGLETLNGGTLVSFGGNLFVANDSGGGFTSTSPLS